MCTGDIHLGRHPGRVPAGVRELSVRHVFENIIDLAIEQDVDVVAFTGDIVDRANRYYEAFGPLEEGVQRLAGAQIPVFAVSGNHDFDVLPKLSNVVGGEYFHLLGRGGEWEQFVVERDGEALLRIVGWSFPAQHVNYSPLSSFEFSADDRVPTVGLIHADLDQAGSPYAPVTTAELQEHQLTAWLLGHIHRPQKRVTPAGGVILYPGSPQALDPGERGVHGPWIVEVEPGRNTICRQIPMATVRYDELDIDLDGVDEDDEFMKVVPDQIRDDLQRVVDDAGPLRRLVYRLRYTGRTALHRKLARLSEALINDYDFPFDGMVATIDRASVATSPARDLDELSKGQDPPAVLARLLLEIGADSAIEELSAEAQGLFLRLRDCVDEIHRANAYAPLRADHVTAAKPDDEWVRQQVLIEGLTLLDELLVNKTTS